MAKILLCSRIIPTLAMAMMVLIFPVYGQNGPSCTGSMLSSFTPCMNYVTNSSYTGTSPTSGCCDSLKSLMSSGSDCICLIATGNVPFQIPINRTLALSLPRACNMPGVPLQCKASVAPIPAPGPIAFSPTLSPPSPKASIFPSPAMAPEADATPADLTPPSSETPTANSGIRPVVTPSAAKPSHSFSPSLLLLAALVLKFY